MPDLHTKGELKSQQNDEAEAFVSRCVKILVLGLKGFNGFVSARQTPAAYMCSTIQHKSS